MWQTLYEELQDKGFTIIAVAMDSRENAARPWIEAVNPTYPALIDRDHRLADLYNMVNVPQAVWIDENGTIVRPTENAGAFEGFRAMHLPTRTIPDDVAATVANAKATYVNAVRDWVERGAGSEHVCDREQALAHLPAVSDDVAAAHAHFRLGQYLLRLGREDEASVFLQEASRLHPDSWNIWRQVAEPNEIGLAAGPEFWARVKALGEKHYYLPVDMKGMPHQGPPSAG